MNKKNKIKNKVFKSTIKHIGNKGLTKFSLGKSIKKFLIDNSRTSEIVVNGYKMQLDKNDVMQLSLFDYEPIETELFKKEIKDGDIVVDIGANIGYFTLLMAKLVGINGKIISFEPEPSNFTLLNKNVIINNYQNVTLEKKGISDYNGRCKFFLSTDAPGMHSLHKIDSKGEEINIDVIKLDEYFNTTGLIDKISLIKIDVEGAELQVLNGMKTILKNKKLKLLIEFIPKHLEKHGTNPDDILKILEKNNFKIYHINEKTKKLELKNTKNILTDSELGRNIYCVKE